MAMVAPTQKLDRAEYRRRYELGEIPDNVYLLGGELVPKMPQNSPHAFAVSLLSEALTLLYLGGKAVRTQCPIGLSDDSEPEPDVAIGRLPNVAFRDHHPTPTELLLVIEVADTTALQDRRLKMPRYFAVGIPEVWLVDLASCLVRRFTPDAAQLYYRESQYAPGDALPLPESEATFVVPAELFTAPA